MVQNIQFFILCAVMFAAWFFFMRNTPNQRTDLQDPQTIKRRRNLFFSFKEDTREFNDDKELLDFIDYLFSFPPSQKGSLSKNVIFEFAEDGKIINSVRFNDDPKRARDDFLKRSGVLLRHQAVHAEFFHNAFLLRAKNGDVITNFIRNDVLDGEPVIRIDDEGAALLMLTRAFSDDSDEMQGQVGDILGDSDEVTHYSGATLAEMRAVETVLVKKLLREHPAGHNLLIVSHNDEAGVHHFHRLVKRDVQLLTTALEE